MAETKVLYKNALGGWLLEVDGEPIPVVRADQYDRALSAAKEAAAELEGLHKAGVVPKGSQDILAMVKAEIEELEGE